MKDRYAVARATVQWALLVLLAVCAGAVQAATPRTVLVFGDSLSAAYGLSTQEGWVDLTAQRIARERPGWIVVNASISGETTTGGRERILAALKLHKPSVVVIELGANDALRGLPLKQTRRNLAYMIGASQGAGAKVLLVGMRIPPNYGAEYTEAFAQGFVDLSKRFDTQLLPFLLAPIARDAGAFQADNLHPIAKVQPQLRDHVWTVLGPMLVP